MRTVWKIVIGTMLLTTAICYGFHVRSIRAQVDANEHESAVLREEVTKLKVYKGILTSGGKELIK